VSLMPPMIAGKPLVSGTDQTAAMGVAEDDARLGRLLRAIRRAGNLTQEQLASAAGVPLGDVRRIEAGGIGTVRVDRVRRLFAVPGGRARVSVWWNGAAADRILDARHAAIVERVVRVLRLRGWDVRVEVTFADFGERGSIDVFAAHAPRQAVGVFEIKSDIGSLEETNRVMDIKERLAPKLALAQFGWRPTAVGRILVVPRDMTVRRIINAHAETMASIYPARSRDVRAWLRDPSIGLRGIWFVSETQHAKAMARTQR
jgi:transcriptional regulator with XRE-family HTH domain